MTTGSGASYLHGFVGDDTGGSTASEDVFENYAVRYDGSLLERLRQRLALRRRILADLRHAPPWALALIVVVFAGLSATPAAAAIAIGRIVVAVTADDLGAARSWVMVVAAVVLADQVLPPLLEPTRELVRDRIDEAVRADLRMTISRARGIEALEDQEVLDDADVVSRWLGTWTYGEAAEGQIALFFLRWVKGLLSMLVIAQLSWLLALAIWLLLVAQSEYLLRMYRRGTAIVMGQVPLRRASRYWGEIAGRGDAAKELRTFGFGRWVVDLQHRLARRMHQLSFDYVLHILPRQWPAMILEGLATALAGFIAVRAATRPGADLGAITAGLSAAFYFFSGAWSGEAPFAYEAARLIDAARRRLTAGLATKEAGTDDAGIARSFVNLPQRVESIRFVEVDFAYPGTSHPVLTGLNLEIRRGESLAIVGENGAGKTTLIKLLAGLYQPTTGRIQIGGPDGETPIELSDVDLATWRRQLAVVFQDFTRLELSAVDNIALVDLGETTSDPARRSDVEWAIATAAAESVVIGLPDGLRTMMSRRYTGGSQLSGGQWQRIALARAFFAVRRGRSVLVMDEPTASLDVSTELATFDRALAMSDDVFTIVLSHRFSTVRRVDRIVVLAGGRVAQDGSHAELMARDGGLYRRMYVSQAGLYEAADG